MIDAGKELLRILEGLDVEILYEMFIDKNSPIPCVSYMQSSDNSEYEGDTVRYSRVSFLIKIYSRDLDELQEISESVDERLSPYFDRSNGNEFIINGIIVRNYMYTSRSIYENRRS